MSEETRRWIVEATRRASALSAQRTALLEVRSGLEADERGVRRQLNRVENDCADLETAIATRSERVAEVDREVHQIEGEIVALRLQVAAARRRAHQLAQEVRKVEDELAGYRDGDTEAREACAFASETMLRLDYKLRYPGGDGRSS